jgi:hypothetical protein
MTTCSETGCRLALYSLEWCRKHRNRHAAAQTTEYARRLRAAGNVATHGTRSRYRKGCRCVACTAAETNYRREYRAKQRNTKTR